MSDVINNYEEYTMFFGRIQHKQMVIAGCIDELTGLEQIDRSLEEKLKQCASRSFDSRETILKRIPEIFPDLIVSESKL